MLKKRILASSMASVMALTSIASVAFADDIKTEAVTKKQLEDYVKTFDRGEKIYTYGSVQGEQLLDALEYADNVIANTSTATDINAAYQMLKAVEKSLKTYSVTELQELINESKPIIEEDNKLNSENDLKYTDGSFGAFAIAYGDATAVVTTADSRLITDAYLDLADAKANLKLMPTVTKQRFTSALKEFETAMNYTKYDSWRRGILGGSYPTLRTADNWGYFDGGSNHIVAYGTLYDHLNRYRTGINEQYENFVTGMKGVAVTSNEEIVNAYNTCLDVVDVIKAFTPDDTNYAVKSSVKATLTNYWDRLAYDYITSSELTAVCAAIKTASSGAELKVASDNGNKDLGAVTTSGDAFVTAVRGGKLTSATITVKLGNDSGIVMGLDANGHIAYKDDGTPAIASTTDAVKALGIDGIKRYESKGKKTDFELSKFLSLDSVDWDNAGDISPIDNHNGNGVTDGDEVANRAGVGDKGIVDGWGKAIGGVGPVWNEGLSCGVYTGVGTDLAGETDTTGAVGLSYAGGSGLSTYVDLSTAMQLANAYLSASTAADLNTNGAAGILNSDIDTSGTLSGSTDDTAAGVKTYKLRSAAVEWSIVNRYLTYALQDKYADAVATTSKTRKDVVELIGKADELAAKTDEAPIFGKLLSDMTDARQNAQNWLNASYADKKYKDGDDVSYKNITKTDETKNAQAIWTALNNAYKVLNDKYNAFKYSYGEIAKEISDVAAAIDAGTLVGAGEALTKALNDCALALSIVDLDEYYLEENSAFTEAREFQNVNRLRTKAFTEEDSTEYAPTAKQKTLMTAYEKLVAEHEKASKGGKLGDLNNDGKITAADAVSILKAIAGGKADTLEKAVADYNNDGKVTAADATAILKAVAAGTAN